MKSDLATDHEFALYAHASEAELYAYAAALATRNLIVTNPLKYGWAVVRGRLPKRGRTLHLERLGPAAENIDLPEVGPLMLHVGPNKAGVTVGLLDDKRVPGTGEPIRRARISWGFPLDTFAKARPSAAERVALREGIGRHIPEALLMTGGSIVVYEDDVHRTEPPISVLLNNAGLESGSELFARQPTAFEVAVSQMLAGQALQVCGAILSSAAGSLGYEDFTAYTNRPHNAAPVAQPQR